MAKKKSRRKTTRDDGDLFAPSSDGGDAAAGGDVFDPDSDGVALHEVAQARYLNYALSVITSRAIPDVRDGLKPVQRRILYTMWQQRLTPEAKHRKCAKVVGDVMGNYHPHGDQAIYDALVRLSQPFAMRAPTIEGSGNFGSLDGDPAAAMRYTECRLAPIANEILTDLSSDTIDYRPNYDGSRQEPVVLPSRLPNLLVNGATGIAVGMATNIPPHNTGEVCLALLKLLDNREIKDYQLVANDAIQGPDFPTGGRILNTRQELRDIYETGQGSFKIRSNWKAGPASRGYKTIHITDVPYGVNKSQLVESIGQIVLSRKMPLILDVRDLSTEDVCIEIQVKKDADEQKILAYLFKHTQLQVNYAVNLTCLIPLEGTDVGQPQPHISLKEILWHFLNFRMQVVTRRLEHELAALEKRIHILEGFVTVFDALDEIIAIIRKSDGKADAAEKIIARFDLDAEQTDAILELKLYRLAKLEILVIQEELDEKNKRANEIRKLLEEGEGDPEKALGRWKIVREEIESIRDSYGKLPEQKRKSIIEAPEDEPEFSAEDFIVAEDNDVLVTADGWVKRQKEIKDPSTTRLREGDRVLACESASTRATMVFFSNFGTAYTSRVIDLPATTGYGEPIQKLFKFKDGERIVAAYSLDPRAVGEITTEDEDYCPPTHALAATSDGYALRFGLDAFVEPSTRTGRRFARPKKGEMVVGIEKVHGGETVIAVSKAARALLCDVEEINYLAGPGKGVVLVKLGTDDQLLGFKVSTGDRDLLTVETTRGGTQTISTAKYEISARGGKGRQILKRDGFTRIVPEAPAAPVLLDEQVEEA